MTILPNNAFAGCSLLASVSLPAVTSVGWNAFENCVGLPSIELPLAETI